MASLFFPPPLSTSKLLLFRANLRENWIKNLSSFTFNNAFLPPNRFSFFTSHSSTSLHSPLTLSSTSPLSPSSLRPLFQPPVPHLRPPLRSMTTPSQPPSSKTVRVVIKGRVQGVFYRNWTVETATQLGLKGWVRNRRDGSVEAVFSGDSDKVQEMEERCRRGPPHAMVTGLQVFPCDEDPGSGFERRPTV